MIDECGGVQWPFPESLKAELRIKPNPTPTDSAYVLPDTKAYKERRLFANGKFFTPDQRARFIFEKPRPVGEPTDTEYPFVLLTGRGTSAQWHTQTRTGKSAVLRKLYPDKAYAEINPQDARRLNIQVGDTVEIASRRGSIKVSAFLTPTINRGQIFLPMHYAVTNQLTFPEFDPYSRQPSYKTCAVKLSVAPRS
jgi:assimilatory nitrate reductase catalytic subunit